MSMATECENAGVRNRRRRVGPRITFACGVAAVVLFLSIRSLKSSLFDHRMIEDWSPSITTTKTKIAYAVSLTSCNFRKERTFLDAAVVLRQSIEAASRSSKYDYNVIAFIHPDAVDCALVMSKLGYEVKMRDTPFIVSQISNPDLVDAQGASCCGFKEYLKLYSYLETSYRVVVHLDLDCILLKPLDNIFDLMLDPQFNRSNIEAMWLQPDNFPAQIDFVFTRDYYLVE
jgi:alpha-N-acetylglucosamine transferase